MEGFDIEVLRTEIPLLNAFENAETEGVTVDRAVTKMDAQIGDGCLGFMPIRKLVMRLNY